MTLSSDYQTIALAYSITALSIAPLLPLFFRQYFRSLEFLQMCYLFASVLNTSALSSKLTTAVVSFDKNILTFCTTGDYVCSNGFPLSFGVILAGILIITFIFVSIQKCCGKAIEYEPVFLTFKGFIRWIYGPLVYTSTSYLLALINLTSDLNTLLPPVIVLGILALFPFLQLIVNKATQKQNANIWQKWLEFLGYLRLLSTAVLVACAVHYLNELYLHLVMIALIIVPIIQLWKGNFKYPIMERVIFFLGEALFIILYYIFRYNPSYITGYDLDVYGLGGIILIDFILYFIRAIRLFCYGANQGSNAVNPELAKLGDTSAAKIDPIPTSPRKNKYEHDSGQELQNSRDQFEGLNKKNAVKKRR